MESPVGERVPVVFIYVTCACGQEFETSEANAGKSTLCPICGGVLTLPRAAPPLLPTSPQPDVVHITNEPAVAVTSRAAIASLVLGVLLFLGCLSGLPAIVYGCEALRAIRWSGGRLRGKGIATTGIVLGVLSCLLTVLMVLPEMGGARYAARRAQCTNNLKQIGLAMHNYHANYGCLPAAAITDKNGKPLLSWRVAVLPFLEEEALFSKFHLDEPWDSPHNLSLLPHMPWTLRCPDRSSLNPGMTTYQVVVGPNTAFPPDFMALTFDAFRDGTQNTVLAIESRHAVPWTKPEDVPFELMIPYSGLGRDRGQHDNAFNALMADGSVRFIMNSTDPRLFRAALTRDGNELPSKSSF